MNISLRDRLLRNQINQMENEYNNIIKNLNLFNYNYNI